MSESNNQAWFQFLDCCLQCRNTEVLNDLMQLFLTLEEREDIGKRLLIIQELLKGEKTQRAIAKDINVSIVKITRGANMLKTLSQAQRGALKHQLIDERSNVQ